MALRMRNLIIFFVAIFFLGIMFISITLSKVEGEKCDKEALQVFAIGNRFTISFSLPTVAKLSKFNFIYFFCKIRWLFFSP